MSMTVFQYNFTKNVADRIWHVGHSLPIPALEHFSTFHVPAWCIHLPSISPFGSIAKLKIALDTCSESTLKTLGSSDHQKVTSWTLLPQPRHCSDLLYSSPTFGPFTKADTQAFQKAIWCGMQNSWLIVAYDYLLTALVTIFQESRCPALPTQNFLLVMG